MSLYTGFNREEILSFFEFVSICFERSLREEGRMWERQCGVSLLSLQLRVSFAQGVEGDVSGLAAATATATP